MLHMFNSLWKDVPGKTHPLINCNYVFEMQSSVSPSVQCRWSTLQGVTAYHSKGVARRKIVTALGLDILPARLRLEK